MISLATFLTPPHDCAYLPDRSARMRYDVALTISPEEYERLMNEGWRRFGHSLFRHECPSCRACRSLRIPTVSFQPNRSQRRAWQANRDLTLEIREPSATREKLALYDRFHDHRSEQIGWPEKNSNDQESYIESFVTQPFHVEEWLYRLNGELVGVGYVDPLPESLSAIYFFHEPTLEKRSLGTYNVLRIIAEGKHRGLEYIHLGYFVEGCRSLEYKGRFSPNETLGDNGRWLPFR